VKLNGELKSTNQGATRGDDSSNYQAQLNGELKSVNQGAPRGGGNKKPGILEYLLYFHICCTYKMI